MNDAALELALKKQRLQIAGDGLREDFGRYAAGLAPVFGAADCVTDGIRWLRRNPQLVVVTGVALVVARPKRAWRWGRRALLVWQGWRKLKGVIGRHQAA